MPWWGWVALGALLLAAELGAVDAEFYLVFLGLSALVVGALGLAGFAGPAWLQWLLFAALALVSLAFFRRQLYARLRRAGAELGEGVSGEWAVARDRIEPGALGRAELRGSLWSARNAGGLPIEAGQRVRVERVEGVLLQLRADA
jgi:membrane protein implicated in regulation of membrane protease activity